MLPWVTSAKHFVTSFWKITNVLSNIRPITWYYIINILRASRRYTELSSPATSFWWTNYLFFPPWLQTPFVTRVLEVHRNIYFLIPFCVCWMLLTHLPAFLTQPHFASFWCYLSRNSDQDQDFVQLLLFSFYLNNILRI